MAERSSYMNIETRVQRWRESSSARVWGLVPYATFFFCCAHPTAPIIKCQTYFSSFRRSSSSFIIRLCPCSYVRPLSPSSFLSLCQLLWKWKLVFLGYFYLNVHCNIATFTWIGMWVLLFSSTTAFASICLIHELLVKSERKYTRLSCARLFHPIMVTGERLPHTKVAGVGCWWLWSFGEPHPHPPPPLCVMTDSWCSKTNLGCEWSHLVSGWLPLLP